MLPHLLAQCFAVLLELLRLSRQTDGSKHLQILLVRCQTDIAYRKLRQAAESFAKKFIFALITAKFKRLTRNTVRQRQELMLLFQAVTVLEWRRQLAWRKWTYGRPSRGGRLRTDAEFASVVFRMANENDWGYGKIVGELRKLSYAMSDLTIANSLRRQGVCPLPQHRASLSWR